MNWWKMLDKYIGKLYKLRLRRDTGLFPECIYTYGIRNNMREEYNAIIIKGGNHFIREGETDERIWLSKNNLIRYYELVEDS